MGASLVYLNKPNKEIEHETGSNDYLAFAAGSMQGWRLNMVSATPSIQGVMEMEQSVFDSGTNILCSNYRKMRILLLLSFWDQTQSPCLVYLTGMVEEKSQCFAEKNTKIYYRGL